MSLFGAMNTAISGLTAQSNAFGNISDNVANSQTVGYKRVDTNFIDYLTTSTKSVNDPGAVVATPEYVNNVQGTITQSDNPLGLAIAGQGFFAVSRQSGETNGNPTFNPQQYYTRAGDFQMDKNGYLVNSAGEYLNGWPVQFDPNVNKTVVNQNTLAPIQVTQTVYNPVATSNVTMSANLPATPTPGQPISSNIDVYDALGNPHIITLNWSQTQDPNNPGSTLPNDWKLTVSADGQPAMSGAADVQFGTGDKANSLDTPAGTIKAVTVTNPSPTGLVPGSGAYTGGSTPQAANLNFKVDFGTGVLQNLQLNFGNYGQSSGLTQYAGTQYNLRGLTQDGVPPGAFSSVTTETNGSIVVNYDNGQSRVVAQVPVVTFNAPDQLQRQDGQSFTASTGSGTPLAEAAGTNGAGNLVTQSTESSNVDIATEFSKLIVAQQAYSASTKMVTTASQMLDQTINMKQ
jgi:flagellar hook protein FlgE